LEPSTGDYFLALAPVPPPDIILVVVVSVIGSNGSAPPQVSVSAGIVNVMFPPPTGVGTPVRRDFYITVTNNS
jgi:hypothetical protein